MKYTRLPYVALIFLLVFTIVSCDNSSGPDEEENPAIIEGRVDNLVTQSQTEEATQANMQQEEGAVVTANRMTSEGTLEPIGEDSAETNANGEFTLEIFSGDISEFSDQLLLRAEREGEVATAFVTAPVERGGTARSKPLNEETTAEAEVYQNLVAQGDIDRVSNADIEVAVTETVAADIVADSSLAGEVATALLAAEQAKQELYDRQGTDLSDTQQEDIREIKTDAQIEYENRLSTTDEQGVEDAYNAFIDTYANAELEAEVNPTAAAKANEVSSRIVVNQLTAFSDTSQAEIRMDAAFVKSFALEAGVLEQLEGLEVSQGNLDNVKGAFADGRTQIREMEGEASQQEVRQVFAEIRDVVITVIDDEEQLNGEVFLAVNGAINDVGGAKPSLDSALEGNVDVLSVMDAYDSFYSGVETSVNDAVEAGEAAYYAQLLMLINAPA